MLYLLFKIQNQNSKSKFKLKILLGPNMKNASSKYESGSTARNASARISTARDFFQKCHLLDTKSVNCSTDKSMPYARTCTTFCFRAVDKKSASARILEQMTKLL